MTFTTHAKARLSTLAALGIMYPLLGIGTAVCATAMFSGPAHAAPAPVVATAQAEAVTTADFQKKTYNLRGSVTVEQRGSQTVLVFSDDFKTKNGPDLKVFLSTNSVADATGGNATTGAVRLGKLKTNKGAQEYVLPVGVSLDNYSSVLVHCEAFSKLWGGADI